MSQLPVTTCRLVYVLLCVLLPTLLCYLTTTWFLLFNYRLYFLFFPHSTVFHTTFSLQTFYLDMVRQDLQQPKLSSNINMMPSNCSHCTHIIQENDRFTAMIAVLQAQLQTQCCRNAQPVSLIQPTETFNWFSPLSSESESRLSLLLSLPRYGV